MEQCRENDEECSVENEQVENEPIDNESDYEQG